MNANVHTSIGLATASGIALLAPTMNGHDKITLGLGLGCAVVGALIPDIDANGDNRVQKGNVFIKYLWYCNSRLCSNNR